MADVVTARVRWWVPGDWNGFFGLFTNVLLNVIVLTTLCLYVVQLPPDTVYGRVLPALGIALPLGNLFYAYLAWQLAKKEGRSDVTAMPYGPSVPHMFIVVLVIMLPTYLATKDAMLAYQAGLRDAAAGALARVPADTHPSLEPARSHLAFTEGRYRDAIAHGRRARRAGIPRSSSRLARATSHRTVLAPTWTEARRSLLPR